MTLEHRSRSARRNHRALKLEKLQSRELMAGDSSVFLSDLPVQSETNVHSGLQFDSVYWQDQMIVDAQIVEKGLGMHAPQSGVAKAIFRVPANAENFRATVALAEPDGNGTVQFRVRMDDELLYQSPMVTSQTPPIELDLSAHGRDVLTLEVDSLGGHSGDHAVFANAHFTLPWVETAPRFQQREAVQWSSHRGATAYLSPFSVNPATKEILRHRRTDLLPSQIQALRDSGGNLLRIQITFHLLENGDYKPGVISRNQPGWTAVEADDIYRTFIKESAGYLEHALKEAMKNDVQVIIDLHTPPGARKSNQKLQVKSDLFGTDGVDQDSATNLLADAWGEFAKVAAKYPNVLGYDILNEPSYKPQKQGQFRSVMESAIASIRQYDKSTPAIIETFHGHVSRMNGAFVPLNDKNVIYSVHPYATNPHALPGDAEGSENDFRDFAKGYRSTPANRAKLEDFYSNVIEFQRQHDVPIYIGEFQHSLLKRLSLEVGPQVTDQVSRAAIPFIRDNLRVFEEYGWLWTYHGNNPEGILKPAAPVPPQHPGGDATDEQRQDYEQALELYEGVLVPLHEKKLKLAQRIERTFELPQYEQTGRGKSGNVKGVSHDSINRVLFVEGNRHDETVRVDEKTVDLGNGEQTWLVVTRMGRRVDRAYIPIEQVERIVFHGGKGKDNYANYSTIPATGSSGRGKDMIYSNPTRDIISGSRKDTYKGLASRPNLVGAAGNQLVIAALSDAEVEQVQSLSGSHGELQWSKEGELNVLKYRARSGYVGPSAIVVQFQGDAEPDIFDVTIEQAELINHVLHIEGTGTADQLLVSEQSGLVFVTMNGAVSKYSRSQLHRIVFTGGRGNDLFTNDSSVPVTAYGGEGNDVLIGGSGNDHLEGDNGHDQLWGGSGSDVIVGGNGDDVVLGQSGDDTLKGNQGIDRIWGGDGSDHILAGKGNDVAYGESGNDTIEGHDGRDTIYGNGGDDTIYGGAGADKIWGGAFHDRIFGGHGDDWIAGEHGYDHIDAGPGNDGVFGGIGNDKLIGGPGRDYLDGEQDDDEIRGGAGHDKLFGRDGLDLLYGGLGNDLLQGGRHTDKLWGNEGDDEIHAGSGNDWVYGGKNQDRLYGGTGHDVIEGGRGHDWIEGGPGDDTLRGNKGNDHLFGQGGRDHLYDGAGVDYSDGGDGRDWFRGKTERWWRQRGFIGPILG